MLSAPARAGGFIGLVCSLAAVLATAQGLSDDDVRQQIIKDSIASYRGSCACPYNFAANGSSCGRRSVYSRPGGASPLCYPKDISPKMLDDYRKRHGT
jgi:hypothetical protein